MNGETSPGYSIATLKLYLEAALAVKARKGNFDPVLGICSNMNQHVTDAGKGDIYRPDPSEWIKSVVVQWPEWSGVGEGGHAIYLTYPVPHPEFAPRWAYDLEPLWDQRTAYGKARMRLLNWLIDKLTTAISEQS